MRNLKKVFQSRGSGWLAGLLMGRASGGTEAVCRFAAKSLAVLNLPPSSDFCAPSARPVFVLEKAGGAEKKGLLAVGRGWEKHKSDALLDAANGQQRTATLRERPAAAWVAGRPTTMDRRPAIIIDWDIGAFELGVRWEEGVL